MKRPLILVLALLASTGALFAQAGGPGGPGEQKLPGREKVIIEGKLAVVDGQVAMLAKGNTYYVGGLESLIGFVDGLREGAMVRLEGDAMASPSGKNTFMLQVRKISLNGRDIVLPEQKSGSQGGPGQGGQGGQGGPGGQPPRD